MSEHNDKLDAEDVVGHIRRGAVGDDPESHIGVDVSDDDVAGHARRGDDDSDDVAGHIRRGDDDDDVEGHYRR